MPVFLKLFLCGCLYKCLCVYVCVHPPLRLLIIRGVIYTPYDWLNKFYGFYITAVVGIVSGHGLRIHMHS